MRELGMMEWAMFVQTKWVATTLYCSLDTLEVVGAIGGMAIGANNKSGWRSKRPCFWECNQGRATSHSCSPLLVTIAKVNGKAMNKAKTRTVIRQFRNAIVNIFEVFR